jgi:hypothetical protein
MKMKNWLLAQASVAGLATLVVAAAWSGNAALAEGPVSFAEDVFPILEIRCLECHQPGGSGYESSGLDLRAYEGLMKGTKYGPIVVPRSAMTSNLIAVVDGLTNPALHMPHQRKRMSKCERLMLRKWVNQGARNN